MIRLLLMLAFCLGTLASARDEGETTIRIVGSEAFPERTILTELGGRLDHITLHPATSWRAADAAFLVEQNLQLAGFNDAEVTGKVVGPREILLQVSEGTRDVLGTVTVNDVPNPKLNKTLAGLFELNPKKRASGLNEYPINDDDIPAGIDLMKQQMQSIGFYDAEIERQSKTLNPQTGKLDFVFGVKAGRISTIA